MFGTEIRTRHSRPSAGYDSSRVVTTGTVRTVKGKGHHMSTHHTSTLATAAQATAIRAEPTHAGLDAARFAPAAQIPAAPVSRLRLTRRGRAVFTTLAAIPLVTAALFMALNGGMATATDAAGVSLEYVTVSGGESLWVVAQEIAPGEDPREVIAQVLRFNELTSPDVVAGQRLAVPSQYSN